MVNRNGASIVTISSVNAFLPDPSVIDYSAAKGALTNLIAARCQAARRASGSCRACRLRHRLALLVSMA